MPACPASFFTIPNKSEGFPTSGNDIQVALLMTVLVSMKKTSGATYVWE